MKKLLKRKISAMLVLTLLCSVLSEFPVFADSDIKINNFNHNEENLDEDVMVEIFRLIEETPDSVLENMTEDETIDYFNARTTKIQFKKETSSEDSNTVTTYGWWENTKCGAAIVVAIGGTVFVGAKLLKLKKYIKALGGAKEAAYLVYLYFHYGEVPENLGATVGEFLINLAEMLLGIDQIKQECGHLFSIRNYQNGVLVC